jgi:hypothetical protein
MMVHFPTAEISAYNDPRTKQKKLLVNCLLELEDCSGACLIAKILGMGSLPILYPLRPMKSIDSVNYLVQFANKIVPKVRTFFGAAVRPSPRIASTNTAFTLSFIIVTSSCLIFCWYVLHAASALSIALCRHQDNGDSEPTSWE